MNKKYIYLIQSVHDSTYKIGVSLNPEKRLKQLQTGNSGDLVLIEKYETENYMNIETALHNKYNYLQKRGEWFNLSLNEEINFIKECEFIDNNLNILKTAENKFI